MYQVIWNATFDNIQYVKWSDWYTAKRIQFTSKAGASNFENDPEENIWPIGKFRKMRQDFMLAFGSSSPVLNEYMIKPNAFGKYTKPASYGSLANMTNASNTNHYLPNVCKFVWYLFHFIQFSDRSDILYNVVCRCLFSALTVRFLATKFIENYRS